jgi:hypothetical protein
MDDIPPAVLVPLLDSYMKGAQVALTADERGGWAAADALYRESAELDRAGAPPREHAVPGARPAVRIAGNRVFIVDGADDSAAIDARVKSTKLDGGNVHLGSAGGDRDTRRYGPHESGFSQNRLSKSDHDRLMMQRRAAPPRLDHAEITGRIATLPRDAACGGARSGVEM